MFEEHPLKVISKIFNIPLSEVAEQLGVSKQTVNEWVGKRRKPIPEKHLPKLSEIFKIKVDWFLKDKLTPREKLELDILKMEQEPEIEMPEYDDEGILLGYSYYQPYINEIRELSEVVRRMELTEKYQERIEKILNKAEREEIKNMEEEFHNGVVAPYHWQGYLQDAYLDRLDRVLNLLEELNTDKFAILDDVLMYLEKCFGKDKSEWNIVRGFGTYLESSKSNQEFCEQFDQLVKSRREGNKIDFLDW